MNCEVCGFKVHNRSRVHDVCAQRAGHLTPAARTAHRPPSYLDRERAQRDAEDRQLRERLLGWDFKATCLRLEPPPGWRQVKCDD